MPVEPELGDPLRHGVDVRADAGHEQPHRHPVGEQEPDGLQQVEHALPAVDPAVVEQHGGVGDVRVGVRPGEPLRVGRSRHEREPLRVDAVPLADLARERRRPDQQRGGVGEHGADEVAVRAAAGADPVPVAALHGHHRGQTGRPRRTEHREPVGVGVLGVQDVVRRRRAGRAVRRATGERFRLGPAPRRGRVSWDWSQAGPSFPSSRGFSRTSARSSSYIRGSRRRTTSASRYRSCSPSGSPTSPGRPHCAPSTGGCSAAPRRPR